MESVLWIEIEFSVGCEDIDFLGSSMVKNNHPDMAICLRQREYI